jgi:predicted CoA-substrate-specific enzyme activase
MQAELVRDFMGRIERDLRGWPLRVYATGSGGRAVAPSLGARYIQEVNAVSFAVERLHPGTGSVVELGGQDAKVVIFKEDEHGRKTTIPFMNDKCAGGTGATIDKIFGKIGVTVERAAGLRLDGTTVHHVAAKCGVFAETDVVGLVKSGIDRDEIIVSLCVAIVKQNLEVLVRGNTLRDDVLLLGGPHCFIPLFAEIWRELVPPIWKVQGWQPKDRPVEELIRVPRDAQYFAAIGAVMYGREDDRLLGIDRGFYSGSAALDAYIEKGRLEQLEAFGAVRDGLVGDAAEIEEFGRLYSIPDWREPDVARGERLAGWLGIDGGSTSTKIAIVGDGGELLYKDYMLSRGNPIADVRTLMARLRDWADARGVHMQIRGAAVTGYAASILKEAFALDMNVVETIAHLRAALAYAGEADVICDIGGQDIKVLFMRDGRVTDFRLNTQCSAGNGYFLQGMAEQFGIPMEDYAAHAFRARRAPAFNYGCAVFMEQDKVNFQQLGWSKEEIMAGLALVLPLNIWNYVVQEPNIAKFGTRFVLQGGTQRNLAAVKAQVDHILSRVPHATVHVHRYADICGAIGAAIEVREALHGPSSFVGIDRSASIEYSVTNDATTRCRFCPNRCPRTFVDIRVESREPVRFITGNSCDKGLSQSVEEMKLGQRRSRDVCSRFPNLVHEASVRVFEDFDFEPMPASIARPGAAARRASVVVGIPKLLNLFVYAPFFNVYFRSLGVGRVVTSDDTSKKLWDEGNNWGSIDPCFPAKVAHAHVYNLMKREEVTRICVPIVTHLESHLDATLGSNACVIQMGTPEVIEAAFTRERDYFRGRGIEYWKPLVKMDRPEETVDQLYGYFRERLDVTAAENRWAVEQGYAAQRRYVESLRTEGGKLIDWLVENDRIGIVAIGHPYHHDPGLNHGLLEEFQKRGFPILCIEALPVSEAFLAPLGLDGNGGGGAFDINDVWVRNFNRNTNHKIWASKVVARHPNLAAVDLSSFKCGHDAPTYSYVDNIMDASGAPHFTFHDIDQNKPHASMKIRIKTFEYFLRLEEETLRGAVGG